jgi:hypothetical protein
MGFHLKNCFLPFIYVGQNDVGLRNRGGEGLKNTLLGYLPKKHNYWGSNDGGAGQNQTQNMAINRIGYVIYGGRTESVWSMHIGLYLSIEKRQLL